MYVAPASETATSAEPLAKLARVGDVRSMARRCVSWIAVVASGALVASCAADRNALVVFAASSLREAFGDMGAGYRSAHPGTEVRFNFAGTQELTAQLRQGARADVIASADPRQLEGLAREGAIEPPRDFACNALVVVTPAQNPAQLHSLEDLAKARRLVIAAPEVPAGRYAEEVLAKAQAAYGSAWGEAVRARLVSRELNVRQVLSKVALGEADAGLAYRTDAEAARGQVAIIDIPPALNVVAHYPIAVVKGVRNPEAARAFVEFVASDAGQRILAAHGFVPCPVR
jgi:molybdate transport system substrate-binding protein